MILHLHQRQVVEVVADSAELGAPVLYHDV